ncbi:MAG: FtsQ-type POTRA domain-containing protein [Candidatus Chlorobium antarcticum]|jgi:cell division protein FtsQ|nr:FtsQ-type POTRA domain-containing protein [Candidatus Chlorobium antarcticum]
MGDSAGSGLSAGGGWKAFLLVFFPVMLVLAWLSIGAAEWQKDVRIRSVSVDGAELVSSAAVGKGLQGLIGKNIREVDTEGVEKRVSGIAWVKQVRVGWELNGVLRVVVVERVPLAEVFFEGGRFVMDTEGVLLPPPAGFGTRVQGLVRVSGFPSTSLREKGFLRVDGESLALVKGFSEAMFGVPEAAILVRELHLERANGSWFSVAGDPARFIVGNDGDFKEKLKKFGIFWQLVISKKGYGCYRSVDLRFRDRVFAIDAVAEP